MNPTVPFSVAERFVMILQGLFAAVAARRTLSVLAGRGTEVLAEVLIVVICKRVRRVQLRVVKLLALLQAGMLPPEKVAAQRVRGGERRATGEMRVRLPDAAAKLPRGFGWLLVLVPCEAANYASQLRLLLAEPEMVRLVASSPAARRALKTLGRMLAIEPELITPKVAAPEVADAVAGAVGAAEVATERPGGPSPAPETWPPNGRDFPDGPPGQAPPLI